MDTLDTLGVLAGTDKSSLRWDYLRHYHMILETLRDKEFNLIELGAAGGGSLRMWTIFFPRATVIGIDIDERCRRITGDRIVIEIGSQADPDFLGKVCDRYPPTIVIDDGSHQAPHILASFDCLFPRLAAGGYYAIEDLNITGSMEDVAMTPHDRVGQIATALMHRRGVNAEIDSVYTARGLAIVRKSDPSTLVAALPRLGELVNRSGSPNNHFWFGEVLLAANDLVGAEATSRRSVELHPAEFIYHLGLADVLTRRGKLADAVDAVKAAIATAPKRPEPYMRLGGVLMQDGRVSEAEAAFRQAVDVAPAHLRPHVKNDCARMRRSMPDANRISHGAS